MGSTLVIEHNVISPRDAHNKVNTGHPKQGKQGVHVVLVGLRVIGVTDVTSHGKPQQLTAEVVFKPGAYDLLTIVQVFRPDKSDYSVYEKGPKSARYRICACLT